MFKAAAFHTYPLDEALSQKIVDIFSFHVQKLVLERRASAIQNKDYHNSVVVL